MTLFLYRQGVNTALALGMLALLAATFWLGRCTGPDLAPTVVEGVPDTVHVDNPVLAQLIEDQALEIDGLRARIEGRRVVQPRTVIQSDTVWQECPEVSPGRIDRRGHLSIVHVEPADSGGYRPSLRRGIDVSRCDEGISFGEGGVVCDPARAGHLGLYLAPGYLLDGPVTAEAGISWRPAYRSTAQVDLFASSQEGGTFGVRGRIGVELF